MQGAHRVAAYPTQDLWSIVRIVPEVRFSAGFRLTRYALSFNYNFPTLLLLFVIVLFEFTAVA